MPKTAYPTGSDLAAYLLEFGITVTNTALLDTLAAAGVLRFERAAGRTMLAGTDQARTYDPPAGPLLDLEADLVSIVSLSYQPQGSSPVAFLSPGDYRLLPQRAPQEGRPWEMVDFRRVWWQPLPSDLDGALTITGKWGYGLTIPEDAWLAMLAAGAAPLWDKALISGGTMHGPLTGWKEASSSESFGMVSAGDLSTMKAQFLADFPATVAMYQKVSL